VNDSSPENRIPMKALALLWIGVVLFYATFLPPAIFATDGNSMLAVAESIVTKGSFAVRPDLGTEGPGGIYYSQWYPLLSLIAVPFVGLGYLLGGAAGVSQHHLAGIAAIGVNVLLTATTTVLIVIAALRFGATRRGAFAAAVAYAFGTFAIVYGRSFFAEPLLALLTLSGFMGVTSRTTRGVVIASAAAGLLVLAKPTGAIMGPIFAAYLLYDRRRLMPAIWPGIGTFIGLVLYAL
jgi:hypothetical protein